MSLQTRRPVCHLPETIIGPYYPYFSFVQPPRSAMGKKYPRLLEESVTIPSAGETEAIAGSRQRSKHSRFQSVC